MRSKIDPDDYQRQMAKLSSVSVEKDGQLTVLNMAALGVAGEGGEFADTVKKILFHGKLLTPEIKAHLLKELGDITWYVAIACTAFGEDFSDILQKNIDKLTTRYHQGKFTVEDSEARIDKNPKPHLEVTMSDGSVWGIPIEVIAKDRANHYAEHESKSNRENYESIYEHELVYTLSDSQEILDWSANNMNWDDVAEHATQIRQAQPKDYHEDWVNASRTLNHNLGTH